jgi:glycerate-2-kinase
MNKEKLVDIFNSAVSAADPYRAVMVNSEKVVSAMRENGLGRILLVAFGKAAVPMSHALMDRCGEYVESGVIITKYGHACGAGFPARISVFEAGHPIPDACGCSATRRILQLLAGADETALVVYLISGGGSALLTYPAAGISLEEKGLVTGLLLRAGADIHELNIVRRHLSAVKGGLLVAAARPARCLSLIVSDVIGDSTHEIASGPTSPDPTTFAQAWEVLHKYGLQGRAPASVMLHLAGGMRGEVPETPKPGDPFFDKASNIIVAGNRLAIEAACRAAEAAGYRAEVLSAELRGEASAAAKYLAARAMERRQTLQAGESVCLVAGGETTVTVKGDGAGGRNTEMALAFGLEIRGEPGVTFLSAGTDGQDGITDAAGAVVDGELVREALRRGLDAVDYLDRNDSYTFFEKTGGLVISGPTGTNVMDLQLILLE